MRSRSENVVLPIMDICPASMAVLYSRTENVFTYKFSPR